MRDDTRDAIALALVLAGGTVGTLARAALEEGFGAGRGEWPWATFGINVVGSFLLGLLVAVLVVRGGDERWRLALGTGVLGGFTTYSTFIVEADRLVADGHVGLATGYALGSVVLGVAAAALGTALGRVGAGR
ncbi:FluC/FEX family fluoride channel [Aeromicrobium sp. 179-A 4D2 NHS]|uniref:FluC/FEX family fluoride channel n=1 Tax=Aeromicrobium sp. 179-A 4D2 NHS TaxID=3142375 RepID=UPI00399F3E4A